MTALNSDSALKEDPVAGRKPIRGWLTALGGVYVVLVLVFLLMKWLVVPAIPSYKNQLESWVSEKTGQTVQVGHLSAEMIGFSVFLRLSDISLFDQTKQPTLSVSQLNAELSWLSLFTFAPNLENLELIKPHVLIEKRQGLWHIGGVSLPDEPSQGDERPALDWLLRQGRLLIVQGSAEFISADFSEPSYLRGLQFESTAAAGQQRVALEVSEGSWFSQPLVAQLEFERPLWGRDRSNLSLWEGRLYTKALLQANENLAFPIAPPDLLNIASWPTAVQLETWVSFAQGHIKEGVTFGALENLEVLPFQKMDSNIKVSKASSWLFVNDYDPQANTLLATFKALSISIADPGLSQVDLGPLNGRLGRKEQNELVTLTAGLDDLNAETALKFARKVAATSWVDEYWSNQLAQFKASGLIKGFDLSLQTSQLEAFDLKNANLQSSLIFENLSVLHVNPENSQRTGFEGFSGRISGDNRSGGWSLSAGQSKVMLQELFDENVIELESLQGQGSWVVQSGAENNVEFSFDDLSVQNQDLKAIVRGKYKFVQNESDWMNIQGLIKQAQVARVPYYLPNVLGEKVRGWLEGALRAGMAENASFIAKGPVKSFPFHDSQSADERFEIKIPIRQAELSFAPDWPAIDDIKGVVTINGKSLMVDAEQASTKGVPLSPVTASIENMDAWEPVLKVEGLAQAELDQLVDYTNSSPVSSLIGGVLLQAQVDGLAQLKLMLEIPLAQTSNTKVNGNLLFDNNRVRLVAGMPWVKNLQGQIDFSGSKLELIKVRGNALGRPLKISGGSSNGLLQIKASGRATAQGLAEYLNPLVKPYLEGETSFDVSVESQGGLPTISVLSDLSGMGVLLPAPFSKPSQEVLNFKLKRTSVGVIQNWKASLTAPSQPKGTISASMDGAGRLLFMNAGLGRVEPTATQGINLNLELAELDVEAWRKAIDDFMGRSEPARRIATGLMSELGAMGPNKKLPVRADLFARSLLVSGSRFQSVRLTAKSIEDRWQFDIDSNAVKGYFSWDKTEQQPNGVVLGRFQKLSIPRSLDDNVKDLVDEPVRSIPALDIKADSFVFGDMSLGQLVLEAENPTLAEEVQAKLTNKPQTWTLNRLELVNPDSVTLAKGTWQYNDDLTKQRTEIVVDQRVSDAGGLLARFGNRGVFKGGKGTLKGTVSWAGPPSRIDYKSLSGQLDLTSQKGQFLKADPGVAKLLGVLSLQGVTRRLSLDFNDLFSQGFAYDDLSASFTLKDGNATTPNFKMVGPSATVLMDGQLNLAKETQNLNVVVLPDLNPTGGSLIYSVVAANPAVGIASLIADFLLKDPLAKVFSLQYKVTGAWSEPNIRKLDRVSPESAQDKVVP